MGAYVGFFLGIVIPMILLVVQFHSLKDLYQIRYVIAFAAMGVVSLSAAAVRKVRRRPTSEP